MDKLEERPFIEQLSEHTLRIRRNLLFFSSVSLLFTFRGINIEPESLFGLKLFGVTHNEIIWVLLCLVIYNAGYFGLLIWDHFRESEVKATFNEYIDLAGMRKAVDDTRKTAKETLVTLIEKAKKVEKPCESVRESFNTSLPLTQSVVSVKNEDAQEAQLEKLNTELQQINSTMENLDKWIPVFNESGKDIYYKKIEDRLNKFETYIRVFDWVQKIKFLGFETFGPILLSVWSICRLSRELLSYSSCYAFGCITF